MPIPLVNAVHSGRLRNERTRANKNKAISFAAYRAAVDLLPGDKTTVFDALMAHLGYDINDTSMDTTTPSGSARRHHVAVN